MRHILGGGDILAESLKGCTSSPSKPMEMREILGASWNTGLSFHCLLVQHFFCQAVERPKTVGVLIASCFGTPIRGIVQQDFSSLYQKTIWNGNFAVRSIFSRQKLEYFKIQISPDLCIGHAIWRRSRIGSPLVRVCQSSCN